MENFVPLRLTAYRLGELAGEVEQSSKGEQGGRQGKRVSQSGPAALPACEDSVWRPWRKCATANGAPGLMDDGSLCACACAAVRAGSTGLRRVAQVGCSWLADGGTFSRAAAFGKTWGRESIDHIPIPSAGRETEPGREWRCDHFCLFVGT